MLSDRLFLVPCSTGFTWNNAGILFIFCRKFEKGLKLSSKKIHILKPVNGSKCLSQSSGVSAYGREQLGRKVSGSYSWGRDLSLRRV